MKRGTLPLNALRAFEATMRQGQMSLAADELGVTYGAVSRQVRGLERKLGARLFEGPKSKLVPTQDALDLYPALSEAFDTIQTSVTRIAHRERRPLIVSCLSTFAMRWLIPHLFDFQAAHPNIDVQMRASDEDVDFSRAPYDVAIRVGAGPWPNATAIEILDETVGPVISPRLWNASTGAKGDVLTKFPILHTKTRPHAWADWCKDRKLPAPESGQAFEHFYFLIEAVRAGLGTAVIPKILVHKEIKAGLLIAPFGFRPSGQSYVVLTPKHPNWDALVFVQWLKDQTEYAATSGPRDDGGLSKVTE